MPPPFTHAAPTPDGRGAMFFGPGGQGQSLYGPAALMAASRLPAPPAGAGGLPGLAPPSAPAPPVDYGAAAAAAPDPAAAQFIAAAPEVAAEQAAARAAPASHAAPLGAPTPATAPGGVMGYDQMAALTTPAPRPGGSAPKGGGKSNVGLDDVGGAPGGGASGEGGGAYDPFADARAANKVLYGLALKGTPGHKAGWVDTTKQTTTEGVESVETAAAHQAAIDAAAAAAGGKAEVQHKADLAEAGTYKKAAEQAVKSLGKLDEAAEGEQGAYAEIAARQQALAEKDDPDAPGLKGLLARLKEQAAANRAGDVLMAINTGADVNAAARANADARNRLDDNRRKAGDEAGKTKVEAAKSQRVATLARDERYADYLANVLKGQRAEYAAMGRLPELEAQIAAFDEHKAKLRGEREKALMGTTVRGSKYQQASGGGPNAALIKAYIDNNIDMGKAELASDTRLAAKGSGGAGTVIIGNRRVQLDPTLGKESTHDTMKQADAQAMAEKALDDIKKARADVGPLDWTTYKATGVITPAMARFRSAVAERAALTSVARGQGAQQDAERKDNEDRYMSVFGSEAHIEREAESDKRNRVRLMRKATGRD